MTGQGRPSTSLTVRQPTGSSLLSCWALVVALVGLADMATLFAADKPVADMPAAVATMRVRIAWGGGAERLWHGTIAVSQGTLGEPRPLGIEADEPGSIWLEDGHLVIRQRSSRSYDGVDVLVTAPLDARLLVNLTAADDAQRPPQIEVPLGELSGEFRNLQLDARDNRLLVRRTPGDLLRVSMAASVAGVFARREIQAGSAALSAASACGHQVAAEGPTLFRRRFAGVVVGAA